VLQIGEDTSVVPSRGPDGWENRRHKAGVLTDCPGVTVAGLNNRGGGLQIDKGKPFSPLNSMPPHNTQ